MAENEVLLPNSDLKVYSKRWMIALTITMQTFIVRYFMSSIGVVNNVYVEYFDISYIAVDWFTTIQYPGSLLVNLVVAWLIFSNKVGLRKLSIGIGLSCIYNSSSMLIASFFQKAYPVIYFGQFIMGASYSVVLMMAIKMANNWFPKHEIGKAMAAIPIGSALAAVMAFLIPTNILNIPHTFQQNKTLGYSKHIHGFTPKIENIFTTYNGILLAITLTMIVPVLAIVQDKPPKPPTKAQALLLNSNSVEVLSEDSALFFLKECLSILSSKVFLIVSFMETTRVSVISTETMFLSDILRPLSADYNKEKDPNILSGYVTSTFEVAAFFGLIFGAYVFDYFKKHKLQLRISFFCLFLCQLGVFSATYFKKVKIIWLINAFLGFFISIAGIPIKDTAVQHLYPTKPGLITSLMNFFIYSVLVIFVQILRLLIMCIGGWAALLFSSILLFFSFSLTIILKPDFKILQLNQ